MGSYSPEAWGFKIGFCARPGNKEEQMNQSCWLYHAVLVSALVFPGLTVGLGASAADQNPCSEDIAKFCGNVKPSQRALMECLEEHESRLSDACKDYEAKMERPRAESREVITQRMRVSQACREDVSKFCLCATVQPATGGVLACLNEHAVEISVPCKAAIEAARGGEEEQKGK